MNAEAEVELSLTNQETQPVDRENNIIVGTDHSVFLSAETRKRLIEEKHQRSIMQEQKIIREREMYP